MKKRKEALRVLERVIRVKVEENFDKWPPICTGILHQPEKPIRFKKKEDEL